VQTPQLFSRLRPHVSSKHIAGRRFQRICYQLRTVCRVEVADDPLDECILSRHERAFELSNCSVLSRFTRSFLSAIENLLIKNGAPARDLLEVSVVRYQLMAVADRALRNQLCKVSYRVFDGTYQTATQAAEAMKGRVPSDAEFREAFNQAGKEQSKGSLCAFKA